MTQAILIDGIYNAEIIIAAAGGVLHILPDSMFLDACRDCGFITDEERTSKYRSLHYCTRPGNPDAGVILFCDCHEWNANIGG